MKKNVTVIILAIILILAIHTVVLATNNTNILENGNANEIITQKSKVESKIEEYSEKYDSEAYGLAAYMLNAARIYSIPICFVGIIIGALNQYVLGTRRLDRKHKGYGIIMTFVTLLVICQVLPLIFTIVVMGWRG